MEELEPQQTLRERTKADNNQLVLRSLTGIAVLCATMSGGVLLTGLENAVEFSKMAFTPVSMVVAGLLVFIKN